MISKENGSELMLYICNTCINKQNYRQTNVILLEKVERGIEISSRDHLFFLNVEQLSLRCNCWPYIFSLNYMQTPYIFF